MKTFFVVWGVVLLLTAISAYITHIFWVFRVLMSDAGATMGQAVLAVIGTLAFPIGILHGIYLWIY